MYWMFETVPGTQYRLSNCSLLQVKDSDYPHFIDGENEVQRRCTTGKFLFPYSKTRKLNQRRQWHPTPILLPGKSPGRRSLGGCSPWGHEELDMTERLPFHFSLSCTGEGNGNPLQCSCLENPRDGGAWWAAVYGVTQSQTQLK